MATSSNSRGLMLLLLTSGFFIIGLLFDYMPMIIDNQIKRSLELATNEEVRQLWSKPPIDINSYYWLYSVENAESRMEKKIIELSQNKYRLMYNSTRHFKLNESAPNPHLDELAKFLNPVYASLMEATREYAANVDDAQMRSVMVTSAARMADKYNESLFINTTARTQLVGRRVELIERLRKLADTMGMGQDLPQILPGGLFGYVAVQNGTWQGPYEVYTGYQASMPSLGDIISFQGKRRLKEFQGRCNRLQASAGELRPMPIGTNQILEMFQPQFCRIVHLQPTGMRKLREGQAISYVLAPEDFLSADANPDNRCFCVNGTNDNYCSLNGVIELAPCAYYSPIVATTSNMRLDPKITQTIHDWDPELLSSEVELVGPADNASQLLILRRFGVPIRADITIILFMKVTRDARFKPTSSVPEVSYIPLLMLREVVSIPPQFAQIIVNVESFLALTYHIKVIMYLSALVLLGWLTGHFYQKSTKDRVEPSSNDGGGGDDGDNGRRSADQQQQQQQRRPTRSSISGVSDRANSADSSRSQRPSRVSQSSLDPGDPPQTSGRRDSSGQRFRREAAAADEAATGSGHGQPEPASNLAGQDELLIVVTGAAQAGQVAEGEAGPGGPASKLNEAEEEPDRERRPQETSREDLEHDRPGTEAGTEAETEAEADEEGGKGDAGRMPTRRARSNWFMKVCSNFVRMLNGLRSTINDAGQLDITENDYQDKQLELLAGKIDNWQRYSSAECAESNEDQAAAGASNPESAAANGEAAGEAAGDATDATATADATDAATTAGPDEPPEEEAPGQLAAAALMSQDEAGAASGRPPAAEPAQEADTGQPTERIGQIGQIEPAGEPEEARPEPDAGRQRRESDQSNQTIINKSDTSGDESGRSCSAGADSAAELFGPGADPSLAGDKASALEQMELALSKKTDPGPVGGAEEAAAATSGSAADDGPTGDSAPPARAVMINSSTSMDSILDGNLVGLGAGERAPGDNLGPDEAHNQSGGGQNDQIDKSSSGAPEQSSRLAANGVGAHNDGAGGGGGGQRNESTGAKDERRDSGVKLDSRRGISDTAASAEADAILPPKAQLQRQNNNAKQQPPPSPVGQPGNGQEPNGRHIILTQTGNGTGASNGNNNGGNNNSNNNSNSNSTGGGNNNLLASRLQQIKGGDTINGPSVGRTKLLNGNNISNGKIMFQRQATEI